MRCLLGVEPTYASVPPSRGYGDRVHRRVMRGSRLPPIVRCAKPRQPVLGTNPNCDRGDFVRPCGALAARRGRVSGAWRSVGGSPMNELLHGLSAARRSSSGSRSASALALLVAPFLVAYKQPDPGKALGLRVRLQRLRRCAHEVRRALLSGRDPVHHLRPRSDASCFPGRSRSASSARSASGR